MQRRVALLVGQRVALKDPKVQVPDRLAVSHRVVDPPVGHQRVVQKEEAAKDRRDQKDHPVLRVDQAVGVALVPQVEVKVVGKGSYTLLGIYGISLTFSSPIALYLIIM